MLGHPVLALTCLRVPVIPCLLFSGKKKNILNIISFKPHSSSIKLILIHCFMYFYSRSQSWPKKKIKSKSSGAIVQTQLMRFPQYSAFKTQICGENHITLISEKWQRIKLVIYQHSCKWGSLPSGTYTINSLIEAFLFRIMLSSDLSSEHREEKGKSSFQATITQRSYI